MRTFNYSRLAVAVSFAAGIIGSGAVYAADNEIPWPPEKVPITQNGVINGNITVTPENGAYTVFGSSSDGWGWSGLFNSGEGYEGNLQTVTVNGNMSVTLKEATENEAYVDQYAGSHVHLTVNGNLDITGTAKLTSDARTLAWVYAAGKGAGLTVNGDVNINGLALLEGDNASYVGASHAFSFLFGANAEVNGKNFSVINAIYDEVGSIDPSQDGGANAIYAARDSHINLNVSDSVVAYSISTKSDAITAKRSSTVDLGSPKEMRIVGGIDFGDAPSSSYPEKSSVTGVLSGDNSFWYGDEELFRADGYTGQQTEGHLNLTFKDGARWVYMFEPRVTKMTLEEGGYINMYDSNIASIWTDKNFLPGDTGLSLNDYWGGALANEDGTLKTKHQFVLINNLNGDGGIFRMDFNSQNKKETDIAFIYGSENEKTGTFRIQAHPENPQDLHSFDNVSSANPLLFAYVDAKAADKIRFVDTQNLYKLKLYDYYAKIETRTYDQMSPQLTEYEDHFTASDGDEINPFEYNGTDKENATYWVITKINATETKQVGSLVSAAAAGWGYATQLDRLEKRMGEIQYQEGDTGLWVRSRHNRLDKNRYDMKWSGIQIGGDYRNTERNRIGLAVGYDNGDADLKIHDGQNEFHGFNVLLYDTWRHEDGRYLDLTARWGRSHHDINALDAWDQKFYGDYKQHTFALGAEGGKRIMLDEEKGYFMEPQAQIQWTRVGGANWTTSNDVDVDINKGYSFIGRLGSQLGKEWVDKENRKNNVYLKADVLREFRDGQRIDMYAEGESAHKRFNARGTWYDVGISTQLAMGERSWVHLDLEKPFGGGMGNSWQINGNVRWNFD